MRKKLRVSTLGVIIAVLLLLSGAAWAAGKNALPVKTLSLGRAFNTSEKWQASAYDDTGPAARLCFSSPALKEGYCFPVETKNGDAAENYYFVDDLSLVPLFSDKEPGYGVLFVAGGGHEIPGIETLVEPQLPSKELGPAVSVIIDEGRDLRLASLWTYRMDERKFVNITPPLTFGSSGEVVLLSTLRPDLEGILAMADCKDKEGFGGLSSEPHTCNIRLFRYSDKTFRFEPAGGYHATTEYGSHPIIQREMKNVEAYLSGSLPTPVPEGTDESGYVLVKTLPLRKTFNTPEKLQASAYEFESKDTGDHDVGPAARLCFEGPDLKGGHCFEAKTGSGKDSWGYTFVKEFSLVSLFANKKPQYALLFVTQRGTGVSVVGNFVTLWAYREKEHQFVNILPPLTYEDTLSQFLLLSTIRPDMEGLIAVADYVTSKGEAHYDWHRYKISLYRYNEKAGVFKHLDSFVTRRRYDDTTVESIFRTEMRGIERVLSHRK